MDPPASPLPLPFLLARNDAKLPVARLRATVPCTPSCTCIPTFLGNLAPSTVPTGTLALPSRCTTTVGRSAAVRDDAPLGELLATEELLGKASTVYRLTGAVDGFRDDFDFRREVVEGGCENIN